MTLTANRQQLIDNAQDFMSAYERRIQQQGRTDDDFTFAEMDYEYKPSPEEQEQMKQLSAIQKQEYESPLDKLVLF